MKIIKTRVGSLAIQKISTADLDAALVAPGDLKATISAGILQRGWTADDAIAHAETVMAKADNYDLEALFAAALVPSSARLAEQLSLPEALQLAQQIVGLARAGRDRALGLSVH